MSAWDEHNKAKIDQLESDIAALPRGDGESAATLAVARATYEVAIAIREVGQQIAEGAK